MRRAEVKVADEQRARADRIASRAGKTSRAASARARRGAADEYHPRTLEVLGRTSLDHRKGLGQYFTPRTVRERLLDLLPPRSYERALDPACGTGEFLRSVRDRHPAASVEGWEIDGALVDVAREVAPGAVVRRRDGLEATAEAGAFDLVIGNPPYFEFKPAPPLRERFAAVVSGRPNVFAFFLAAGLDLLREGGVLAFVVPQSMNNGAYFAALRGAIRRQARIVALEPIADCGVFFDAQQSVMLLVLEKGGRSDDHVFRRGDVEIFTADPATLERAFEGKTTLAELGCTVRTGRVVWNQRKDALTDDASAVPLFWPHNIGDDGALVFPVRHERRPQYIRAEDPDVGPAILVNRVSGASARARLRAAVVQAGRRFFAENHVNVVFPPRAGDRGTLFEPSARGLSMPELVDVARELSSPAALRAVRLVTGNTQVSSKELARLVPLALDRARPAR